jgi:hypothetical protein
MAPLIIMHLLSGSLNQIRITTIKTVLFGKLTGIQCRELELKRREMERCKIRNREKDMGKKEGNNEDREKHQL